MIKKLDHFVITTNEPDSTINFYEKLGFRAERKKERYMLFAGDFKINVHVLGKELKPHAKNVALGSADFCLEIDGDIDEFAEKLKRQGLVLKTQVVDRNGAFGTMKSIYLYDPNGNLVEVCSYE